MAASKKLRKFELPAPPPPPPPLPSALPNTSKDHKLTLKVKDAPPGWFHQSSKLPPHTDFVDPKTGIYFFYGTLMDPKMLAEILDLDHEPHLRPAFITGYTAKLWGQYPALIDGEAEATAHGVAYEVQTVGNARRLAEYETNHYKAQPCLIKYADGKAPDTTHGRVFIFAGNLDDLEDGTLDLSVWLKRVGR